LKKLGPLTAFDALRERNYLLLWLSTVVTSGAMQMETVVLSWYILQVTGSPFLVGLLTAFRTGATMFGTVAGTLADRMSRKGLVLVDQMVMVAAAAVMIVLLVTKTVQPWHVFAAATVTGLARVFDQPARQALVADSVAPEKVANAIGLNLVGMNAMWAVGPLLAGVVYATAGPEGGYAALLICYLLSAVLMLSVHIKGSAPRVTGESMWRTMWSGVTYLRGRGLLISALIMAAIANLTAFPFMFTLMPVYAEKTLGTDSTGFGLLLSAVGVGTIIGAIIVTVQSDLRHMGRLMALSMFLWHLSGIAIVFTDSYAAALPLIVFNGVMQSISMGTIQALLLGGSAPEYRGRILGLRSLAVYPLPLGSTIVGWMIGVTGVSGTTIATALAGSLLVWVTVLALPVTWKVLRSQEQRLPTQPAAKTT
jgi:predicted MFS family arabinose efflux permease